MVTSSLLRYLWSYQSLVQIQRWIIQELTAQATAEVCFQNPWWRKSRNDSVMLSKDLIFSFAENVAWSRNWYLLLVQWSVGIHFCRWRKGKSSSISRVTTLEESWTPGRWMLQVFQECCGEDERHGPLNLHCHCCSCLVVEVQEKRSMEVSL